MTATRLADRPATRAAVRVALIACAAVLAACAPAEDLVRSGQQAGEAAREMVARGTEAVSGAVGGGVAEVARATGAAVIGQAMPGVDRNGDGQVGRDELGQAAREHFDQASKATGLVVPDPKDAPTDLAQVILNPEQAEAWVVSRVIGRAAAAAGAKPGEPIRWEHVEQGLDGVFARADADGDGRLDAGDVERLLRAAPATGETAAR